MGPSKKQGKKTKEGTPRESPGTPQELHVGLRRIRERRDQDVWEVERTLGWCGI